MRMIWQGTDSLYLVTTRLLSFRKKLYVYALRLFARIADFFVTEHYCCGRLVEDNLRKFKMRKPLIQYKTPVTLKIKKIPHKSFNILLYRPHCSNKLREWIYGFDLMDILKQDLPKTLCVTFIEVDGYADMTKIYPVVDVYVRPNRHDGESRMVRECVLNNIPCYFTLENPDYDDMKDYIQNIYNHTITKQHNENWIE